MSSAPSGRWLPRLLTFVVWALLAASAAYWTLGSVRPRAVAALPVVSAAPAADSAMVARLLGARAPEPGAPAAAAPADNRFKLVGVLARGSGAQGAALISVDGKPAQPYRVGSEVDAGIVLRSVGARSATLARTQNRPADATGASRIIEIELPPLAQGGLTVRRQS